MVGALPDLKDGACAAYELVSPLCLLPAVGAGRLLWFSWRYDPSPLGLQDGLGVRILWVLEI